MPSLNCQGIFMYCISPFIAKVFAPLPVGSNGEDWPYLHSSAVLPCHSEGSRDACNLRGVYESSAGYVMWFPLTGDDCVL